MPASESRAARATMSAYGAPLAPGVFAPIGEPTDLRQAVVTAKLVAFTHEVEDVRVARHAPGTPAGRGGGSDARGSGPRSARARHRAGPGAHPALPRTSLSAQSAVSRVAVSRLRLSLLISYQRERARIVRRGT